MKQTMMLAFVTIGFISLQVHATNLTMIGTPSLTINDSLSVGATVRNDDSVTSNTVRLEVWALASPFNGSSLSGYKLGDDGGLAGTLSSGRVWTSSFFKGAFSPPPSGTWNIAVIWTEFDGTSANDGFVSRAYTNMGTHTFGSSIPPPSPELGVTTKSMGSRGTVSASARLYGGFELASTATVYILVRGNSLGTLGVTQAYLDAPRLQLFDAQGKDLITQDGMPGSNGCVASNSANSPVANYYAQVRGQPADPRDACYAIALSAGVYTFSINPSIPGVTSTTVTSAPASGEVLFEVSLVR